MLFVLTCAATGTIHLDQLWLEGRCPLPTAPSEQRRWRLVRRWTPRRTLAEGQHWRAAPPSGTQGWTPAPGREVVLGPAALAPTYRQLRKAFEDGKNEPGAADFYYGEMEMRRHNEDTPRAERASLSASVQCLNEVRLYPVRVSSAEGRALTASRSGRATGGKSDHRCSRRLRATCTAPSRLERNRSPRPN